MRLTIKVMTMFVGELLAMLIILCMLFISLIVFSHQLTNLMSLDCPLLTESMANVNTFDPLLVGHMESSHLVITVLRYRGDGPPHYVDNNYYCEASRLIASKERIWYMNNTLWDRKDCYPTSRCCDNRRQPWFFTALPDRVNSNIEVRWMDPQNRWNGMVGI